MEERKRIKIGIILQFFVYALIPCNFAAETVSANQILRYNETIVSRQETFELGFFSPGNSTNHYVGIWYKKISKGTVVWVMNPNTPLSDSSGELTLTSRGILIIRNTTTGNIIWSSTNSSSTSSVKNPIGQLLDSGNFLVYNQDDVNQEDPIWQSFHFMTNTLLSGMKLGWNLVTGMDNHIRSPKSNDDLAFGEFSYSIDIRGYPQLNSFDGHGVTFRGGPFNGIRFTGMPNFKTNRYYNLTFVINKKEIYYQYNVLDSSITTRLVIQPSGRIERFLWSDSTQEWNLYLTLQTELCDQYSLCGPFGVCNNNNSPFCLCLKGFKPVSPDEWRNSNWSRGCQHATPLDCEPGDGFKKFSNLKLPDTQGSWYNQTMSLSECEKMCKSNCSCTAYANSNMSGTRSGCLLWFGDLMDIRTFSENGDTLYIRLSASELDSRSAWRSVQVIVPVAFVGLAILVSICIFYQLKLKKQHQQGTRRDNLVHDHKTKSGDEDLDLPLFGLSTILKATNNFSLNNKLGEGGFGVVYKGVLEDRKEIAVKRLAKTSTQGLHEFKNEVILISKLQHRNLVKLLGCCIEGTEVMLVYEYMQNKGLDSFIFDKTQNKLLDWHARYHIIIGIARGLLYLHQDSRLRIIHRDLKVSNILLDKDMNPKISDFGMARTFGGNQIEAKTNKVVGTYGYMAPEYAGRGIFSIKSDVYSFGVLLLEIVCGEKNREIEHKEQWNNLIGHAWALHNEGESLQLVAKCLGESINVSRVLRSIHVGLLCVQHHPEDRPTMTSVILMLGSEGPLPSPKEPGFYVRNTTESSSLDGISANNELSITILNGR